MITPDDHGHVEQHRLLFEQHPDPMFELDADGRFLAVNQAFVSFTGLSEDDLLGSRYQPLVHPDDRERSASELRRAMAGEVRQYELRVGRSEQSVLIAATKLPIVVGGEVVAVYGIAQDITTRRRAQAALEASEQRFRGLFEGSGSGIAITDRDGRILDANLAYLQLLGYSIEEMRRTDLGTITHPDDRERSSRMFAQVVAGTLATYHMEKRYLDRAGDVVWARVSASRIGRDPDGPAYLAVTVENITAAKEAEQDLQRSEMLRRMAGQLALVGGWAVEASDHTLYLSDEVIEILDGPPGYQQSLDQALAMYAPADRERVTQALEGVLTDGRPAKLEVELDTLSGRRIPVRVTAEAQRGDDGSVERVFGAFQDLTELRRHERQLVRQAALLEEAQDAIVVQDLQHRVTYWNKSAERIYGWSPDEVMGEDVHDLLYEEGPADLDEAISAVLQAGRWTGELRQRRRDGTPLVGDARWSIVDGDDGRPEAILSITTDVTAQRAVEHQLLRAQRMESLGTLAGGVAHDLNNVLWPILLASELLQLDQLSDQQTELLRTIHRSAQRGAALVSQVLSFARGVEGVRIPVDVGQLLADLRAIVRDTFPKNIQVLLDVPSELGTIIADSTQVQQVLLNLAVNARDAMPAGGHLTISASGLTLDAQYVAARPEVAAGRYLLIAVQDSGVGMTPEVCDRIFEPFFTTKPHGAGTGLGLSTAAAIVRSHGGHLYVYSEPGRGTIFHLYLPQSPDSPTTVLEPDEEPTPRGQGQTVLVIDDEPVVRSLIRQTLETHGYQVLEAADGAEAMTVFVAHRDDVAIVLTDMMMPVMDGTATVHALKRIDPEVRIIGCSGLPQTGRERRVVGAGVDWFLPKPFRSGDLLTIVAQALRGEH